VLNLRGGEPFYNKKLQDIIAGMTDEQCRHTMLHITTNATTWNQQWSDLLSRFRMVRVMLSIDAVGDTYEYIRRPAVWQEVSHNVDVMMAQQNLHVMVHCVVQNLNIQHLKPLILWCRERDLFLEFDRLQYPSFMTLSNLSAEENKKAQDHVEQCLQLDLDEQSTKFLTAAAQELKSIPPDAENWQKVKDFLLARDQLRGMMHDWNR
jgi:molybdenum cofactor biosynthesis enzyme MoaA